MYKDKDLTLEQGIDCYEALDDLVSCFSRESQHGLYCRLWRKPGSITGLPLCDDRCAMAFNDNGCAINNARALLQQIDGVER
jgi:hypothetical protein